MNDRLSVACVILLAVVLLGLYLTDYWGTACHLRSQGPRETSIQLRQITFYEVYIRGFCKKWSTFDVDHLCTLGCNAVWLTPIHPSPSSHGYDVIDYFDVHSDFGTLREFRFLVRRLHAQGIHVYMDLVLNHASTWHPWFQQALQEPTLMGQFRRCFHFAATPPSSSSFETASWHRHEHDTQDFWYQGTFGPHMPDWNLASCRVSRHHLRVAQFWLVDVGVDGFRLDAVQAILRSSCYESRSGSWSWLREFSKICHQLKPSARILGELTMNSTVIATAVTLGVMDLGFEFSLTEAIYQSVASKSVTPLAQMLALLDHLYPDHASYVTFLSNHDQDRAASRLRGSELALATVLWLLLPGVPCVYYGDEVGMQGCHTDPDRRRALWDMVQRPNTSLYHLYNVLLLWRQRVLWRTFKWKPQTSSRVLLSWAREGAVVLDLEERTLQTTESLQALQDAYNACNGRDVCNGCTA
jgi:glycosidase